MRLGIYGGSFDPVHNGHLALAQACQSQAGLDEVWFTPTAVQPLKQSGPQATDAERVEMLQLAIESETNARGKRGESSADGAWRVCTLEIERGGLSYTVDTLRQIHTELPDALLYFMMGADTLKDVARWKSPAEIFRLATPLVVSRAGRPAPDVAALASLCSPDMRPQVIAMPAVDVSSTEIRRLAAACEPLTGLVPQAVANYIAAQGLYR